MKNENENDNVPTSRISKEMEVAMIEYSKKLSGIETDEDFKKMPKISKEMENYIIETAKELARPLTKDELKKMKKDIKYPGLAKHQRAPRTYVTKQQPKKFFGIFIGWIR